MQDLIQIARAALTHVYWIGGPGCSGKSSLAQMLGQAFDLHVYHVDDELEQYALDPHLRPARWREYDYAGKQGISAFDLPALELAAFVIDNWQTAIFIETLRHLLVWPRDKAIVVEGVFLPESLLKVASRDRIAAMVADRAFHERYFAHRHEWFAAYEDKAPIFRKTLDALDEMDRQWIAQAGRCQVPLLRIGALADIEEGAMQLAAHFALERYRLGSVQG
jgi:hypothetical protein